MIGLLASPVGRWGVGLACAAALLGGAYWLGGREARQTAKHEALIDYVETLERMDDEDIDLDDADAVRRRLCELADLRDCPVPRD